MGLLRCAISLIAATIMLASPCTAKIVKFENSKIDPPGLEERLGRAVPVTGTWRAPQSPWLPTIHITRASIT